MAAFAIALAAAVVAPAARASVPPDFFGVDYRPADVAEDHTIDGLGAGLVRQVFPWAGIEYDRGRYTFQYYDSYVETMARKGIRVLPVIFETPTFFSAAAPGAFRPTFYPPRQAGDLARFAADLVRRYGPGGSFWREHADIPALPIRAWQIWNEANLRIYWPTGPNARQYVRLLKTVGRAIKRVDRGAEIVTGGLPQSRLGIPLMAYVRAMYRAGGRSAFDTLAIHPYGRTVATVLTRIKAVRQTMNRFGDRGARIWLTEIGWASAGPPSPFTAGADGQAALIRQLFPALVAQRERLGLRGAIYYNWKDESFSRGSDFWGFHTGLVDDAGDPKPAWGAYQGAVAALR
jgi:hypothetical protein